MSDDILNATEEPRQITTSRGYVLSFIAIPTLMAKLSQQYPAPLPPTYEVQAAGGTQRYPHDESTLETEDDRAAWASYQEALRAHTQAFVQAQLRLCLMRGIEVKNAEQRQEDWETEQRLIGFKIPENAAERKLHWLETEVLSDSSDLIAILSGVSLASGVNEEVVSTLEATFWRALGRQTRNASNAAEPALNRQELVDGHGVRANGHRTPKQHPTVEQVGESG